MYKTLLHDQLEVNNEIVDSVVDKDTGLNTPPVAMISNQTVHERNIAFSCNHKLIEFITSILPKSKESSLLE